ncbi:MAG: succinate dehydrogenase [Betaproteobacteria bacterium]|nr:succinate dehydrogenase [Betaproteobacteria bacterium]
MPEATFAHCQHRWLEARGRPGRAAGGAVSTRAQTLLWMAQRVSAAVLALCVVVHLATMIYAVRGGLTAVEILARTRGSIAWLLFYMLFVLATVVHLPIGLRAVLGEWLGWRSPSRDAALLLFAAVLAWIGMRAVLGVFL